ncbi:hypothetical protein ACHAWF_017685, partial [Thalassiosira exigua]
MEDDDNGGGGGEDPVLPLRDPAMDDVEKDQQSTVMFLVLELRDQVEAVSLPDGKGQENRNDMWNLGSLFGVKPKREEDKAQGGAGGRNLEEGAPIAGPDCNGVLRWRMLPLHAALAFSAPFDVVLRLYHLYPGAVHNRDDQGMLALHHCFKYGAEDRVLELLLN